ncbi:hypothetical protein ACXR2U_18180 [Jatrophihabitans sp. YIM 134969]
MSTPWGDGPPPGPYGERPAPQQYGAVEPYGGGPVDPYAGQAAPPVPTYNPYVNPGSWEPAQYLPRQSAPGTIVAGTIVGYVFSLFLFVTGLFLLFFGSIIGSSFGSDSTFTNGGATLVLGGLGNWIAVALFITGGVLASLRRPAGLYITLAASGLVVVLAVYWMIAYPEGVVVFWAFLHVVLALVPAGLVALPPGNRAWLAGVPGSGPPPPGPYTPPPFPTDQYGRPFGT